MTKSILLAALAVSLITEVLGGVPRAWAVDKVVVEPPSEELLKTRDPFKRPSLASANQEPRSDIELFPVEQMKLVGVLTGPARLKAMISAPNGKTYFISERQKIGIRKGIVTRITPTSVMVVEKVMNILGKEENVSIEIKLGANDVASGSL